MFLEGGKNAQLRSKTASSSTSVRVVTTRSLRSLRGHHGHYAVTRSLRSRRNHFAVINDPKRSRGHFAVTSRSRRSHNAVTLLCGHNGHYAVIVVTVTTRSLRGHCGHYALTYDVVNFIYASNLIHCYKIFQERFNKAQNGFKNVSCLPQQCF